MKPADHNTSTPEAETAFLKHRDPQPIPGAVARVFLRTDASRRALKDMEAFLEASMVGDYAIGRSGSPRMGYWHVIDVTDRRDLDSVRAKAPYLIDGWLELAS